MTILELSGCSQVTDAVLGHFSKFLNLRYLNLFNCRQISDAGISQLKFLKALLYLNLGNLSEVTDDGISALNDLSLERLILSKCSRITDKGTQFPLFHSCFLLLL